MALAPALVGLPSASASVVPRQVDYLRISITDRCNERCLYCLPENFSAWTPREELLSYDEILAVVRGAVGQGFRHFRVTGGEPLIREGAPEFIGQLIATPGVETVQLTTNGTRLPRLARELKRTGLERINVSLDALDPEVYRDLTRGSIEPVLEGIALCRELGFRSLKLNTVLMRGKNDDQIEPLIDFAARHDLVLRFIELMPVSLTEMLDASNFLPVGEVMQRLRRDDRLEPIEDGLPLGRGPAKYYRLAKRGVTLGFIGALTDLHFCDHCNKMRLTADGNIRPCLGNHIEFDLKPALRPTDSAGEIPSIAAILQQARVEKPLEHLFRNQYQPQRIMTAIGG